jgi:hypothetical protein
VYLAAADIYRQKCYINVFTKAGLFVPLVVTHVNRRNVNDEANAVIAYREGYFKKLSVSIPFASVGITNLRSVPNGYEEKRRELRRHSPFAGRDWENHETFCA